ncbi:MAG: hypothetical protein HY940_02255 [Gammaproteobacteria bacterium]|nr:hypothetical protein [Gammaproteobacteria bacterium]
MEKAQKKSARLGFVLLCTAVVWIFKWIDCQAIQNKDALSFGGVNAVAKSFASTNEFTPFIIGLIFLVLIVTHLRILFGIEFSDEDSSFNNAMNQLDESTRLPLTRFMDTILSILAATTVFLTYFVSVENPWLMSIIVFIEGALIIIFDIKFSYILLDIDDEKKTNSFIIVNDFIFFFLGCVFVFAPILAQLGFYLPVELFIGLASIYLFILVVEFFVQYLESMNKLFRVTADSFKAFISEIIKS